MKQDLLQGTNNMYIKTSDHSPRDMAWSGQHLYENQRDHKRRESHSNNQWKQNEKKPTKSKRDEQRLTDLLDLFDGWKI